MRARMKKKEGKDGEEKEKCHEREKKVVIVVV